MEKNELPVFVIGETMLVNGFRRRRVSKDLGIGLFLWWVVVEGGGALILVLVVDWWLWLLILVVEVC